jgi:hypothetical protein
MYPAMTTLPDAANRQHAIARELERGPPRWIVVILDTITGSFYGSGDDPARVSTVLRTALTAAIERDYQFAGFVNQGDSAVRTAADHPPVPGMLTIWERRAATPAR